MATIDRAHARRARPQSCGLAAGLQTLVDYTASQPATLIDPIFPNTPASAFWSSSFVAGQTANAWYVAFYNGDTNTSATSVAYQVRCVH